MHLCSGSSSSSSSSVRSMGKEIYEPRFDSIFLSQNRIKQESLLIWFNDYGGIKF